MLGSKLLGLRVKKVLSEINKITEHQGIIALPDIVYLSQYAGMLRAASALCDIRNGRNICIINNRGAAADLDL